MVANRVNIRACPIGNFDQFRRVGRVRLTEFWGRMEERFGADYSRSVAADYRLPLLGATVNEALSRGDDARDVWRAVVAEFEMPSHLR